MKIYEQISYMYVHTSFVFACFTVVKFKGKFVFKIYEQLNDNDLCDRKLTSSLKDIQGCRCCFWCFLFVWVE